MAIVLLSAGYESDIKRSLPASAISMSHNILCGMKELLHSQTSTVAPLKYGNG